MKIPPFILLLLAGVGGSAANAQDTTYFNSSGKETTADKAFSYVTKTRTDSGWRVANYSGVGKIVSADLFADDSLRVRNGESDTYNERGIAWHRNTFKQGKTDGEEDYYYPDGRKKVSGMNKAGEYDGEWFSWYPSGKLAGKAVYAGGKQVSAAFFHEDGSADNTVSVFIKESEFPGGPGKFIQFLSKNLKYPDNALKKNIQGTVILLFKVTKEGRVADLKVVQSVDRSLDAEAMRVLRLMPDWEPAVLGGIPFESYKKQPIVFRF